MGWDVQNLMLLKNTLARLSFAGTLHAPDKLPGKLPDKLPDKLPGKLVKDRRKAVVSILGLLGGNGLPGVNGLARWLLNRKM
jgi:hypothetical protein